MIECNKHASDCLITKLIPRRLFNRSRCVEVWYYSLNEAIVKDKLGRQKRAVLSLSLFSPSPVRIICHLLIIKYFCFQLSRSLTASTLTTVSDTAKTLESSTESSSAHVTVIVIDKDERQPQRSPSVDRYWYLLGVLHSDWMEHSSVSFGNQTLALCQLLD